MKKIFFSSIWMLLAFTILTGIIYPAIITIAAQRFFPRQANGSLVQRDGQIIGSELLVQKFEGERYFWPRPSAGDFATVPSGSSNLSPTSADLQKNIQTFREKWMKAQQTEVAPPEDLITTSGSGLDPHISLEAAQYQAHRVAQARNLPDEKILAAVDRVAESPQFYVFGEPRVNILLLNLALDDLK